MPDHALRMAIIGCGTIAQRHIVALEDLKRRGLDEVQIVAVCDANEEAARGLARMVETQLGSTPTVYLGYEDLLRRERLDTVDICLPHGLHHGTTIDCLEAGAHVLCEKPLGITVKASRRMAEAADRTGHVLSTAVPYRRLIGQRTVHWILNRSELIGRPLAFFHQYTRQPRPRPAGAPVPGPVAWRQDRLMSGGGPAMDSGFHYCDSMRYLLGEVEKVYAETRELSSGQPRTLDQAREDTVFATLTFKNGVVGTWCFGMTLPGETLGSVVFYGSEGSLSDTSEGGPSIFHLFWRNPPGRIEAGRLVRRDGSVIALEDLENRFLESLTADEREALFPGGTMDGFAVEIWDFVESVRGRRPKPEVDGWEGLRSLALCQAIYESAASGEAVRVDDVVSGARASYQKPIDARWEL